MTTTATDKTCFAFYTNTGLGFIAYQDRNGHPVPSGELALSRWNALGRPTVCDIEHARRLGLCD